MTSTTDLSHLHRFVPATVSGKPPILLLHGTGGDENDLLLFGQAVAPGFALLSPRGKVLEAGMPRFFRRLKEGIFDEEDVRWRASELADFIDEARDTYRLEAPIAVGFSNGANVAAAVLQLRPEVLSGAVLLRAMVAANASARGRSNGEVCLDRVRRDRSYRAGGERGRARCNPHRNRCNGRPQDAAGRAQSLTGRHSDHKDMASASLSRRRGELLCSYALRRRQFRRPC